MSATDDAKTLIASTEALHTSLAQAWLAAVKAGNIDKAKALKVQADRAGDDVIDANQDLLDAVDSGQDVTELLKQITDVATQIKQEQAKVTAGTADMTEVSGVLDTLDKALTLANTIAKKP
jgi:ABC-type Na+ transport system ATPase subunit NatA